MRQPLRTAFIGVGTVLLVVTTGGVLPMANGAGAPGGIDGVTQSHVLYRDVVNDRARDVRGRTRLAGWADIRQTSRTVLRMDGHRRIRVTVRSRRDFPIPPQIHKGKSFFVVVDLDTRRGPRSDYHFDWRPFRKSGICDFDQGIDARIDRCRLRYSHSGALWMSGRLRHVKVTKHIRFRTYTANTRITFDEAPNQGWRS